MPAIDKNTGQPVSDDPDQEDEALRGGNGRGQYVDAKAGPPKHSSIVTGPNNEREARRGFSPDGGNDPSGSNATGGV